MSNFTIEVTLLSDTVVGSGEGFGAVIDTDVVFDDIGIPYIPGRRMKGCLRDSAQESCRMFDDSKVAGFVDLSKNADRFRIVDYVFGTPEKPSPLQFSNLTINDYYENRRWLAHLMEKHKGILSKERIVMHFTGIRQQTGIDDSGVADEHTLRTVRAVKKGNTFAGTICVGDSTPDIVKLLWLACRNLRHLGTKRNRGFGEIDVKLFDETRNDVNFITELEDLCRN